MNIEMASVIKEMQYPTISIFRVPWAISLSSWKMIKIIRIDQWTTGNSGANASP